MSKGLTRREFLKYLGIATASTAIPILSAEPAKNSATLEKIITPYTIGDTGKIELILKQKAGSYVTFFNMHNDENTAVKAAEEVVKEYGGKLIELKHKGTRNITFNLNRQQYEFDPNRIFSEKGIEETLRNYGNYSKAAHMEVKKFSEWLLKQYSLDESKVMVTIHNNTDGGTYSVLSYLKGGKYECDAKKVNEAREKDPDDFFFVTKEQDYTRLASLGFNVVLQDNERVKNDGSLSVYWGKEKKTPYINVEAQGKGENNHLNEQVEMIKAAIKPHKIKDKQ